MAANVKMITPPHVAENQRIRAENAGLRAANAIMAAKLAELGVDAQTLMNETVPQPVQVAPAAPAPVYRVPAPPVAPPPRAGVSLDPPFMPRVASPQGAPATTPQPSPTRPPQFAEAQIGGARVTARAQPAPAARGPAVPILAGPAPRMPAGVPQGAAGPVIRNPDGSSVQLLPNVTRNAQPRAQAPAPPVVAVQPAPVQAAPIVTPSAPDSLPPAAPPTTIDDDAKARFSLLEID